MTASFTTERYAEHVSDHFKNFNNFSRLTILQFSRPSIHIFSVIHADGSAEMVFTAVCASDFSHDISKTDADITTKLDTKMFHDES